MKALKLGGCLGDIQEVVLEDTVDNPIPQDALGRYRMLVGNILDLEDQYTESVLTKADSSHLESMEQQRILLAYKESRAGGSLFDTARRVSIDEVLNPEELWIGLLNTGSLKQQKHRRFI